MKQLHSLVILLLSVPFLFFAFADYQKVEDEPSDMLYSHKAIRRLRMEIAAKNASFDPNGGNRMYVTIPQGVAGYLSVEGLKAINVKKLIDAKSNWKAVAALLNKEAKTDSVLFFKTKSANAVSFSVVEMNSNYSPVEVSDPKLYFKDLSGEWVYSFVPRTSSSQASINAMYIYRENKSTFLPQTALSSIRYTDHLIDTNTSIFTPAAISSAQMFRSGVNPLVQKFIRFTHNFPGKPDWNNYTEEGKNKHYHQDYTAWEKARTKYVDEKLSQQTEFHSLLNAAYREVSEKDTARHFAMDELELYVEKYISPAAALELKRKRVVVGVCSMDQAPINHASNIARLAGETCCMEIFLRAHLNILNDRFDRVTDGSYAEPGRSTYAKELEAVGTKLDHLIPGMLLVAENLSANHYWGSINRLGRAMAELQSRKVIYERIESLIATEKLDIFNRVRFVFLAGNYNHYLFEKGNKEEVRSNLKHLRTSLKTFPPFISDRLIAGIASIDQGKGLR